ncbi:MAG: leucyl aminopeptidase family protein [Planctomycetota bacterium]|nr:leucyl aminopeptidase family protein [Planctomycetota bacterium]
MFESVRLANGSSKNAVLVLGHFKGQPLDKQSAELDAGAAAAAALKRPEATGELGRIVEAFPPGGGTASRGPRRILIVGLGDRAKFEPGRLRDAAAAVGRRLALIKETDAAIELAPALRSVKADIDAAGSALGEGLGLIAWVCDDFKGTTRNGSRTKLTLSTSDPALGAGIDRGLMLADSANAARTLSHTPPNICTPAYIAAEAQKMARKTGLRCTVFKGADLERERFTGLINVGKASEAAPCMIRLEYIPEGGRAARAAKPVVLIGKTMTYDSGGLSLKINNGMRGMKRDKDGGCAVFGAMHAIATVIKPRRRVVAFLAAAENSISDEAYRPDDVITYRNGVTVEVTNTDAEGRLVLADALCYACDKEDPAFIVDLATLTGGVVVALGSTYAGMWCDDEALRARIEQASARSGERVWRLPHHEEYRDMMKSDIADIINSNPERKAHPIQGAAFLSFFVTPEVPWCHLDIAGVHAVESDRGPFIKNSATGWGVRLLAELLDAG